MSKTSPKPLEELKEKKKKEFANFFRRTGKVLVPENQLRYCGCYFAKDSYGFYENFVPCKTHEFTS